MKHAIILASHTIGLGAIRSLGIMNVPVIVIYYNKDDMGYLSKYVEKKYFAPHPEKDEANFLNLLINISKDYAGGILIPTDDATLVNVSKNKDILGKYYTVACSDYDITRKYIDKKYTYDLAKQIGIPAPESKVLKSMDDAETFGKQIKYPAVLKPCYGHRYQEAFKRKMVQVENFDQMMKEYLLASENNLEVMLQELIPGDDTHGVNYNSYYVDGDPKIEFTARKVRLSPPKYGVPRVLISKDVPEILEMGRKFIRALGYNGYSCMEFKKDERDGIYKLMELNGRINLSSLHALKCGINFPWVIYKHLVDGEITEISDFKKDIYWIDLSKDIISSIIYRKQEKYTFNQYITPYLNNKIFAIYNINDPLPFIKRSYDIVKTGIGSLVHN